jgi:adenosylcobinamide kinase/adenosylcobinamide-phosphate guanylyltransferase
LLLIVKIRIKHKLDGRVNMFIVIIGGSGSGKSEYAENLAVKLNRDSLIYIATMQPFGEEGRKRIERHQKLRKDKNFQTIECYTDLSTVSISQESTVLLECMSNLVANEMFSDDNAYESMLEKQENKLGNPGNTLENPGYTLENHGHTLQNSGHTLEKVMLGIRSIINQADHLVIVTNNVFEDGFRYDDTTMEYMKVLGQVNLQICTLADQVIEVVHGIPVYISSYYQ